MRVATLAAAAALGLVLAACGKSDGADSAQANASPEDSAAAAAAAADASSVTSIPGYTPGATTDGAPTTAGNATAPSP